METVLHVQGMSCGHCEKAVKDTLMKMDGVNNVAVHLDSGKVDVTYDEKKVNLDKLADKVEEQGYDVVR